MFVTDFVTQKNYFVENIQWFQWFMLFFEKFAKTKSNLNIKQYVSMKLFFVFYINLIIYFYLFICNINFYIQIQLIKIRKFRNIKIETSIESFFIDCETFD